MKQSPDSVEKLLSDILLFIETSDLPLEAGVEIDFKEIYTEIHPKSGNLGAIDTAWQYYEYIHPLRDEKGFWQSSYRITEKGINKLKEIKHTEEKHVLVRYFEKERSKRGILWAILLSLITIILAVLSFVC